MAAFLVVSSFSGAAALSTAALTSRVGVAAATEGTALCVPLPPAILPVPRSCDCHRQPPARLGQPAMLMGGGPGGEGGFGFNYMCGANNGFSDRSAAYRAQQRAMRGNFGHQQSELTAVDGHLPPWAGSRPPPPWAGSQPPPWAGSQPPPWAASQPPPGSQPSPTAHGFEAAWVMVFNAGKHNEGVY